MNVAAARIHRMRDQLLTRGMKAAAVLGFFSVAGSLARIWSGGWHPIMALHIALYLIVVFLVVFGHRFSFTFKAGIITGVVFMLGVGALFGGGFASFGLLALFCFSVLTTIFFGSRAGIISCAVNIGIVGVIGMCVHLRIIRFSFNPVLDLNSPILWITALFTTALSIGIIVVVLGSLNKQVEDLARTLQEQNEEIKEKNRLLEHEIAELDRTEKERKALEGRLRLAQKMETIGKLAGGVAHDLNNTLGSVIGYPELILMDLPPDSRLRDPLEKIQRTGMKAAAIVHDMLALARCGVVETNVFDMNSILDEYFKSPEFDQIVSFHPNVRIESNPATEALNVRGSFFHISKVLSNLVSNAAEAMPDGGKITISTSKRYLNQKEAKEARIEAGECAVLCVSDTGIGIPEDEVEKIYEPFYTRKTMGRSGTGLGMTVVWNSVRDHRGHIEVESREGSGSKFSVYIPLTSRSDSPPPVESSHKNHTGRGETILVVDDVPEQREIAARILSHLGYKVQVVGSGEEAVACLTNVSVDLVLLDMYMGPGMDGLETYRRMLDIHPNQKAIIVSGYSETDRIREALSLGAGSYLKKPFLYNQIGHAVRSELDRN
jgi:signal transduction histidine kinase/ActR/RegA family two-component response regulator